MLSVHSCPIGNLGAKDTGGMSVYIRELACELGRQGHLVDVYTRIHSHDDSQIVELGCNTRLIHLKAGDDEEIHKLAVYSYLPDFACNLENFRRHNLLQYDLVFSHYWLSGWVGEYLQQWWHIPHIIMFHTLGTVKNTIGIGEDESELRLETESQLAKNCHRIIAATYKEKEQIIRHYGASAEKIDVVPCGVNLDLFRPLDKELGKEQLGFDDNKVILFVGRIDPLKGIERLLEAMAYLRSNQGLKLVIIGGDEHSRDEIERLQKLSCDLNIQQVVTFLGTVKHEDLPLYYNVADVCVVPSYYESFGLVALESLACGTPVVATDVGSLRSIIRQGRTGYVVTSNAPRLLANKIALALLRSNPVMKSPPSIRESVVQFSWPNIAQMIIDKCHKLLANYPVIVR